MPILRRALLCWTLALCALATVRAPAWAQEEHGSQTDPKLAAPILGVDPSAKLAANEEQIERAKAIGKEVVCLCGTCPKRTITDCDCGWAGVNQDLIRNAVVQGKNREQIIAAYQKAYGERVNAMIRLEGFGALALVLPYAAAVVGLLLSFWVGWRLLKKKREAPAPALAGAKSPETAGEQAARAELQRELEDMD